MIRSRLGLKALVLSGLVLGLMAFATSSALAEVNSTWLLAGYGAIPGASDLLPHLEITEVENNKLGLFFKLPGGTEVEIVCTTAAFDKVPLMTAAGGLSLGSITFGGGCETFLNKALAKLCSPANSPGQSGGTILTLEGEGLLVLDNGSHLVKITPETAGKLSKHFVTIQLPATCSIGEEVPVETTALGEGLWIEDGGGNAGALTSAATHLIKEAAAPLHKLLALGQPAVLLGSVRIGLAGVHKGTSWLGDWN